MNDDSVSSITHYDKPHIELEQFLISTQEFELSPPTKICLTLLSSSSGFGNEIPREDHWYLSPEYAEALIVHLQQTLTEFRPRKS